MLELTNFNISESWLSELNCVSKIVNKIYKIYNQKKRVYMCI